MTPRHERPTPGPAADIAAKAAAAVPVIDTDRLTLRAPRAGDFDGYAEIVCAPRGRFVGGPMSRADAWWDYVQLASGWMLHGHGGWTAAAKPDGDIAGFVVIGLEPGDREPELGFLFRAACEGKGLAHEAASAARDFAYRVLRLRTLVSYITPGNTRSIRLAERLGARRDTAAEAAFDPGDPILVYRHTAPETLQ